MNEVTTEEPQALEWRLVAQRQFGEQLKAFHEANPGIGVDAKEMKIIQPRTRTLPDGTRVVTLNLILAKRSDYKLPVTRDFHNRLIDGIREPVLDALFYHKLLSQFTLAQFDSGAADAILREGKPVHIFELSFDEGITRRISELAIPIGKANGDIKPS